MAAAASISGVRIARVTSCPSIDDAALERRTPPLARPTRDRVRVVEIDAVLLRPPGDGAVHRAGVDVAVAQALGERPRDGAFAGARRTVDGDDERPRAT